MLFNKNNYRKVQTRKTLHKVGKEWKVVSVALLMAIAGGAVATHANAHASVTNDNNNVDVNSTVQSLETPLAANSVRTPVRAQSAKSQSAKSVAPQQVVSYYPGSNGSAASYFDKSSNEASEANTQYSTVNAYVQSLNAEYNPQVSSFAAKSASANNAGKNDSKLAQSYSATANDANTVNVVNSLAANQHMDPTLYKGMVQDQEQAFSGAVQSASNDVNAANFMNSVVNRFENTNLSAASLSASASDTTALSNYFGAVANQSSVNSYYGSTGSVTNEIDVADKLSAGARTLLATLNPTDYDANLGLDENGTTDAQRSTINSNFTSAVATAVSSAKASYSDAAKNVDTLSAYAYGNVFNKLTPANSYSDGVKPVTYGDNNLDNFNKAVSAAAEINFAPYLASAANSLYGHYNIAYANYRTRSLAAKSAEQSASDEVLATSYAYDFAYANSAIVSYAYKAVSGATNSNTTSTEAAASVAANLLSGNNLSDIKNTLASVVAGTTGANGETNIDDAGYNYGPAIGNNATDQHAYLTQLSSDINNSTEMNLVNDAINNGGIGQPSNAASFANSLASVATKVNSVAGALNSINNKAISTNDSPSIGGIAKAGNSYKITNNVTDVDGLSLSGDTATKNVVDDKSNTGNNSISVWALPKIADNLSNVASELNDASEKASSIHATFKDTINSINQTPTTYGLTATNSANDYAHTLASDALLSDGVDLSQLNSSAFDDVNTATKSAAASDYVNNGVNPEGSAERLNNALSVAASSAGSALNSAQNASASDSAANEEDITLSSYFASSYTSNASSEFNVAQNASAGLNNFFKTMAGDPVFTSADDAYSNAEAEAENDYKLGVGNAKAVYNSNPHFLNALKNAAIHTTPNFGTKPDKVVASVKKGDRLTVYGVNVSRNNFKRGVVRYYVLDNANGKKGFITGQPNFTTAAYLNATSENADVSVKTLKPVNVYDEINGKKVVTSLKAGTVVDNVTVVPDNGTNDAMGFTKVETPSDDFFSANTDYVEVVRPEVPNNNTNTNNNTSNFDLNNFNGSALYYNDNSGFNFKK